LNPLSILKDVHQLKFDNVYHVNNAISGVDITAYTKDWKLETISGWKTYRPSTLIVAVVVVNNKLKTK
jgi:hypothetical protein